MLKRRNLFVLRMLFADLCLPTKEATPVSNSSGRTGSHQLTSRLAQACQVEVRHQKSTFQKRSCHLGTSSPTHLRLKNYTPGAKLETEPLGRNRTTE